MSWSKWPRLIFATATSIRGKNYIVTNTLYPSMEKQKSKDRWSHGEKKGVIWHDMKGERDSSSV